MKSVLKTIVTFLQPTIPKCVFLIIAVFLGLLCITEYDATSKVTWIEAHGWPLTFFVLTKYQGPCSGDTCIEVHIQDFFLCATIFNILVYYLFSCALDYLMSKLH